jgi:cyclophilin family peptidyl-prolyl cis-trans isomerase
MKSLLSFLVIAMLAACAEKAAPPPPPPAAATAASPSPLLSPDPAKLAAPAPDSFTVRFTTSRGPFDVKIHRDWAPIGADHLYYLVGAGFYDDVRFYRVMEGFMAQFGASGDTAVARVWNDRRIMDDPVRHRNERGALTYAKTGEPNSRTTQLFINFTGNQQLDGIGFAPLGVVTSGMAVVDSLYHGYGEGAPNGQGPDQERLGREGNVYLKSAFPKLDYIVTARIAEEWRKK